MKTAYYVARIPYAAMDSELLVGPYASWDEAQPARHAVEDGYDSAALGWDRIDVIEVATSGELRPGSRNAEFGLPVEARTP